jgi:hypothetical protein
VAVVDGVGVRVGIITVGIAVDWGTGVCAVGSGEGVAMATGVAVGSGDSLVGLAVGSGG